MKGLEIIRASTRTPSRLVSSGLHPVATTSGLKATGEGSLTVSVAGAKTVSIDRAGSARLFSSGKQRPHWARVRDALSVAGLEAVRQPPPSAQALVPDADTQGAASEADEAAAPAVFEPGAATADAPPSSLEAIPSHPRTAAAANPASARSSSTSRIELTIDSLRSYELVKPIPVLVESLGERHYVAEVPDLNITTSASSLSEILIVLKNSITQTYDELRIRKSPDAEQARQLRSLEGYIGKSKRTSWLDRH